MTQIQELIKHLGLGIVSVFLFTNIIMADIKNTKELLYTLILVYKKDMAKRKKSTVNKSGNYTKPGLRKRLFNSIKASAVQGTAAGQWSARKAQLLAKRYKAAGGGYKS